MTPTSRFKPAAVGDRIRDALRRHDYAEAASIAAAAKEPPTVGRRLAEILAPDDEAGTSPADQGERADFGAAEGDRNG